jgi:hypothetical protein
MGDCGESLNFGWQKTEVSLLIFTSKKFTVSEAIISYCISSSSIANMFYSFQVTSQNQAEISRTSADGIHAAISRHQPLAESIFRILPFVPRS